MYPIRDYFLIGDLHTAALVSKNGSIDWLCLPHFDSPSIFAGLLDAGQGGTFAVVPSGFSVEAAYRRETAIVEHEYHSHEASFSLYDFMLPQPVADCQSHVLIRKFVGRRGVARITVQFDPRPDYGRGKLRDPQIQGKSISFKQDEQYLVLHVPKHADITRTEKGYSIKFTISEGDSVRCILTYGSAIPQKTLLHEPYEARTEEFWRQWIAAGRFFDFCRSQLVRSAITLKLMQFYPTGAIIAAPTTSLPEEIGGERNWDYRYVWVRDATFSLYALYVLGYTEEAVKFFEFIERIAENPEHAMADVRLMYTIQGERVPREEVMSHLDGYQNSTPVHIGNDATAQFQLDVYGSLIDAHYFMAQRGVPLSERSKTILLAMFENIAKHWHKPDNGIWEVRSGKKHFTYSKAMAWVGLNRGLALCERLGVSEEKQAEMKALEKEIYSWIWNNCYDAERGVLVQHPETTVQDATNFLLVALKFLNKHDSRTKEIIRNTAEELLKRNIFIDRYHTNDGLKGDEGAFVLCTFWYISALAITGEISKAEEVFDAFSIVMEHSGLLSEEIDERTGEYLGNFPQAFSHMGYIMSAYYLDRYSRR